MGTALDHFKDTIRGRCPQCSGSGMEVHYVQAAEVLDPTGKYLGLTDMTKHRRCTRCGGSGRAR